MAKTNWDITGTSPNKEAVRCISPINSLRQSSATSVLWYNGDTNITNVRFIFWVYTTATNNGFSFYARYPTKVSTNTGYKINFYTSTAYVPNGTFLEMYRYNSGVGTTFVSLGTFNTGAPWINTWHKMRVGFYTQWGGSVLRVDWWNGSSWVYALEYGDASASKITTGGYAGFGFENYYIWMDDIQVIKLT